MKLITEPVLPFVKLQGSGNDFVAIDNRSGRIARAQMPDLAKALCRRAFGVGADGLFLLENPDRPGVDYVWQFYNADGSRAEMCGNGSRCAARLAFLLGMAPAHHVLGTDAGPVACEVYPEQHRVKVRLTPPTDVRPGVTLDVDGASLAVHFVNTGVPHAVVFVDDVAGVDLPRLGRALRFHPHFAPAGTNANFAQVQGQGSLLLRTYERGVEAETYACGTGASAAVFLAHSLGLTGPEVAVTTSGGEQLTIGVAEGRIFLTGGAEISFTGELNLADYGLA